MHYDYRVYGLALRASRRLPHLVAAATEGAGSTPDVCFDLGHTETEVARLTFADERGTLGFAISPDARRVWCDWSDASDVPTLDDVAAMLVGPVLGYVLRLRGEISLHASVIGVGGRAIVILGAPGSGKSTTAAALAKSGHSVLSDDVAAIRREGAVWVVHPGYPRVRLAPASAHAFGLAPAALPEVLSGEDKRYVRLTTDGDAWRFGFDPLELSTVYVLDRCPDVDDPRMESIRGAERVTTLMGNRSSQRFMPADRLRQAHEFAGLARLAAEVPVRRLTYPDSLDRLGLVRDLLLDDLAARG